MRVDVGSVEDLPNDRCVVIADGAAIVIRVDGEVVAFRNECLHQASPLAGGLVKGGVLTCPLHFWRYDLPAGTQVGTGQRLESYPVVVDGGSVCVELPDPEPPRSVREMLLEHAEEWKGRDR